MEKDVNIIHEQYFDKDFDEVKILPVNTSDDSDEEMAQQLGY